MRPLAIVLLLTGAPALADEEDGSPHHPHPTRVRAELQGNRAEITAGFELQVSPR
jgi:hypothetical protein